MKSICSLFVGFILLVAIQLSSNAQIVNQPNDSTRNLVNNFQSKQVRPFLDPQRFHFSMNVGAGYSGGSAFSGSFTTLNPNLTYQASPKLNVQVGGILLNSNNTFYGLSNVPTNTINTPGNSKMFVRTNQIFAYTNVQYLLTKKLTLTGSAYTTANLNNSAKINPYFQNFKGMNVGFDYKISDYMSFGAQFNFSNYNNNFLNQGMYSPFSTFSTFSPSPYSHGLMGW
jgi:hypothetical protein